jgi:hypothetical protein
MGAGNVQGGVVNETDYMRYLLSTFLILITVNCFGQNIGRPNDIEKVIISFFSEIQSNTIDPEKIWTKYVWFESQSKLSTEDRIKIFAEHISSLSSQECAKCIECQNCKFDFEDKSLSIKKLKDVEMHHLNFPDSADYEIYVIVQRNEILQYVSVRDKKIAGFYTIKNTRDGNGLFLGY